MKLCLQLQKERSYVGYIDANAGFCNDRTPYTNYTGTTSGGGIGTTETFYATYIRLLTNKAPTFSCASSSDLFTASGSSKGNGALTYPIGLITTDEVAFAGGVNGTPNPYYYLYTGQSYWTMSPLSYPQAVLGYVVSVGTLSQDHADNSYVRPVINLRADVSLTGSGTATDPYQVAM